MPKATPTGLHSSHGWALWLLTIATMVQPGLCTQQLSKGAQRYLQTLLLCSCTEAEG